MARPFNILRLFPLPALVLALVPAIVLTIALAIVLAPVAHADVLDEVLERGKLRVGLAEFAPWTMRDEEGGLIGFEVDLSKKLAEDMGVNLELRLYPWEQIIDALNDGDIDIIAAGMAITPERALQVNFTIPVATSGVGIATNTAKTTHIATLVDMNDPDVVISTVEGTFGASVAERLFPDADIRRMSTPAAAQDLVVRGRAHALVTSMPEARFAVLRNPDVLDLPITEPILASKEALAVKKGEQELLNFLNAWTTARDTDKWIPSTHDYWFGTLDWLHQIDGE